jgi:alkylhydroperoxidase family enzyme
VPDSPLSALRIPPLPEAERDAGANELLDPLSVEGVDLNIFTTLVRHPRLFKRWSAFGGTLLFRGELPARDRELLILRTAWNTRAEYEWGHHASIALGTGLSQEDVSRVADGPEAPGWSPSDADLLRVADELHRDASVSDATWSALAGRYDELQLIEVCMLVVQYHLVAFLLNSLGVEREPGVAGFPG